MVKQNLKEFKNRLLNSGFSRGMGETATHIARLVQSGSKPRILFMPSHGKSMGCSMLRAYCLVPELQKLGWRVTVIPPNLSLAQRRRIIKAEKPDICVIQKCRHPYNSPALYPNVSVVFDLDDADYLDPKLEQHHIDCVKHSALVIAGSSVVADWCKQYNKNVHVVWTGTPIPRPCLNNSFSSPSNRKPIITWASSFPAGYPEEMKFIRSVLLKLAETNKFEFRLYGKTESDFLDSELALISSAGVSVKTYGHLKYEDFIVSLSDVAIGYQPISDKEYSQGKSFGKILAYLLARVPVIASNALEHPLFFSNSHNGYLANDLDDWVAYSRLLLDNAAVRDEVAQAAFYSLEEHLTAAAASKKMDAVFRSSGMV